ncbi:hypothetical protein PSHI8_21140 [Polynucleobacter sp. SHI8]|uniref:oxygenase MpaB family protein n=1 Tax=unclassified Polynucleobacter TaxID=2640945 RepID=UPI0024903C0D|nr:MULTISPECIES: oxygenase MpaB family protein [unclassified Polynucleobacter]BDW12030.1 hypothetical protein PSHI2_21120 [Polynucleobacter sp. SHI2]BDW14478.1 hypothetical protein PSHI8_21140 [Polynucleobacter sp. SHI8]
MIKQLIIQQVRSIVNSGKSPTEFLYPPGDPGLFGPDSVVWKVHGDFMSMMIGGISSLILQALHPLALSGVWDHSSFREDLKGRLGRTAFFIAATTYGNTEMATRAITRVKKIHDSLGGFHPDGRSYRVSDPRLLYWVHLTEAYSFLNAHRIYVNQTISESDQNQYFAEMSKISEGLGCIIMDQYGNDQFARTISSVNHAIESYFPELEYSDRSKWVVDLLENLPADPKTYVLNRLIIKAGFYNLPDWAYPMMNRPIPTKIERQLVNQSIHLIAKPVRWAMTNGVHTHAKRRMGIFD